MTPEQFEQAKREFAEKLFPCVGTKNDREYRKMEQDSCFSDLTSLLEQHKEMMMEFVRWLFWCDYRMTEEGLHSTYVSTPSGTLVELYEWWLKNVKQ